MCGVTRYDLPEVAGLTEAIADSFGPEDPLQRAYAHVVLGYAARLAGDPDTARRRYGEAMRISELNEDTVVNLMARYNLAMLHFLQARPTLAAEELAHWLSDARNKRWRRAGSAGFLNAARALMLAETGRFGEALAEADAAIQLLATTRTYAYVGIAQALRASLHFALGDILAAEHDLEQAREIGRAQQLDRVTFRASLVAARIACRLDDSPAVDSHLAAAYAILEQSGQTRDGAAGSRESRRLQRGPRGVFAGAAALATDTLARARRGCAGACTARRPGASRNRVPGLVQPGVRRS